MEHDGMEHQGTERYVVLITASNAEEAAKIAFALVDEKLAKCVNIIKDIRSIYFWQGKVEDGPECLMIAKTQKSKFPALTKRVKELHSYSVPEIIALPIVEGSEDYLKWLDS
jgi:periplasmic divalent cation tolerance protein